MANPDGPGVFSDWDATPRSVEIIIPTHNNLSGLKTCVEGILLRTHYPGKITLTIIANRCSDPEMLAYLENLADWQDVNLVSDSRPFNWAALNNSVAARSQADLLLFMNDDVEIRNESWLMGMNRFFELDKVGIVGARLYYPNGALQHNGDHTAPSLPATNIQTLGIRGELAISRNVAAVTGACMLVERQAFEEVGGFDERFTVNYNDVDFCLAVRHAGYRIVLSADVSLIHHESISRGGLNTPEKQDQWNHEAELLRSKWGDFLTDPYWTEFVMHSIGTRILHVA
jgi:GT2 family glycosyltransferase